MNVPSSTESVRMIITVCIVSNLLCSTTHAAALLSSPKSSSSVLHSPPALLGDSKSRPSTYVQLLTTHVRRHSKACIPVHANGSPGYTQRFHTAGL